MKKKSKQKFLSYLNNENLSVEEFSKLVKIPMSTLYSWIQGNRSPKLSSALKVERFTSGAVTVYDFE
jgi:predicted transcriptional regulator